MKHIFLFIAALFGVLSVADAEGIGRSHFAENEGQTVTFAGPRQQSRMEGVALDARSLMPMTLPLVHERRIRKVEEAEEEFIFDPEGEEKQYCMASYAYDQSNQRFVRATSLLSRVRYDADGSTVYFKDLTTSLGVDTWLKGTIDGDTIRVPYGQPLAYYKSKYLIFLCPMLYNDNTAKMEVQDELKYVIKGDSLVSPTFGEGIFQCVTAYVFISEAQQGALSYDLDHAMRLLTERPVTLPEGAVPMSYVMTYTNSADKETKTKKNVAICGEDIYMQLSTSATEAYIHGRLKGDSICVAPAQYITDSKFVYYYSLSTPVYNDSTGRLDDFVLAPEGCYLRLDPETRTITSIKDLFGVDYMDGLETCMDYSLNLRLDPYEGDRPARPAAPEWKALNLGKDVYQPYISFVINNLDVDGNYINPDSISYCLYFDIDEDSYSPDEAYEFTTDNYITLREPMTTIPYNFKDGYDFWTYGQLRYVYIYEKLFFTVGVQVIYTVDGVESRSDVIVYDQDTEEFSVINTAPEDVTSVSLVAKQQSTGSLFNLSGQRVGTGYKGICIKNGRKVVF